MISFSVSLRYLINSALSLLSARILMEGRRAVPADPAMRTAGNISSLLAYWRAEILPAGKCEANALTITALM